MIRLKFLCIQIFIAVGITSPTQGLTDAGTWLKQAIESHFAPKAQTDFQDITTKRYAEYKQDAINIDYDVAGALTKEQFKEKWQAIYDIRYAGIGESFLLGQQDHGIVTMPKRSFRSQPHKDTFIFDMEIHDNLTELTYSIEITVIKTKDGFRIDDVKKRL